MAVELPRDIELALARKFDIDTRRALGIYSKLRIPAELENSIAKTYIRRLTATVAVETNPVSSLWLIIPHVKIRNFEKWKKNIIDNILIYDHRYHIQYKRIFMMLRSYILNMTEIPLNGLAINAGFINDIDNKIYIGMGIASEKETEFMYFISDNRFMSPAHMKMWNM